MSKIEWTEETWNPTTGCTKVSAGCKNCYAEKMHKRLNSMGLEKYSEPFSEIVCHENELDKPLHWRKPAKIFVNSMSDLFHANISFEFVEKVWDVIYDCPQHTFQILTKRPERMLYFANWLPNGKYRRIGYENAWLGTSVENQKTADERIKYLLKIDADIKWLSIEPLLENIDISFALTLGINWVIVGCESGHKRRECKIEWVENIVDQCKKANVPAFVKQLNINGKVEKNINKFPNHLRIREYPIAL